ncbi:hypothetical protein CVT25_008988 [Psilocybe cyanescens]|uniref:Uncharacterized protein n=1 Tax=Psilocybe cyanescens TaxID=93625 RepID=A0A409XN99_PSICY|nr:hypothetical protein CVT25_008988 [Psilocybe cyanescens]
MNSENYRSAPDELDVTIGVSIPCGNTPITSSNITWSPEIHPLRIAQSHPTYHNWQSEPFQHEAYGLDPFQLPEQHPGSVPDLTTHSLYQLWEHVYVTSPNTHKFHPYQQAGSQVMMMGNEFTRQVHLVYMNINNIQNSF